MRKQTVILTCWLAMPFICITFIMTWIFVTLDKDKLMAGAPPVGAGAGDTGNANALGQWLAGRDPDAVANANKAIRERTPIDPRDWPGGVVLYIPTELIGTDRGSFTYQIIQPERGDNGITTIQSVNTVPNADHQYELALTHEQIAGGNFSIRFGDQSESGSTLPLKLPMTTPPIGIQSSDPIPVLVRKGPSTIP